MEPEGTRKVTEGDTRGRGPKGTSPSGKSNVLVCYQLQKWQSPEESACDYCTNPKVDAHVWRNAYSSTKAKPVEKHCEGTIVIHVEQAKEMICALEDARSILKKIVV